MTSIQTIGLVLIGLCLLPFIALATGVPLVTGLDMSQKQIGSAPLVYVNGPVMGPTLMNGQIATVKLKTSVAAVMSKIEPNAGQQGDIVSFNLTGSNFNLSADKTEVVLELDTESIDATDVVVLSDSMITGKFQIPDDTSEGEWNVVIYQDGNRSNDDLFFTIYAQGQQPPYLSSINPKIGVRGTTITFTLTGFNFDEAAEVTFKRDSATLDGVDIDVQSATTLKGKLVIPAKVDTGIWNVTVTQKGLSSNDDVAFTVSDYPPVVQKIWPNVGAKGTKVLFTMVGKNFQSGVGITLERPGMKVVGSGIKVLSTTKLTGTFVLSVNTGTGLWDVKAKQGSLVSNETIKFTVVEGGPVVTSIDPKYGRKGKEVPFTISGKNFKTGCVVTLNREGVVIKATNVAIISSLSLKGIFKLPTDAALGDWNILIRRGTFYSNNNILFKVQR